jgi:hypothetical protein
VLVGAQAIYLRTGEADLAVAPYTTDGDLALDPALLAETPPLERNLGNAGFLLKGEHSVGIWITHRETSINPRTEVAVDLLVPASVSPGKGRRAARLLGHDKRAARIVKGLEGSLIDYDVMRLPSLDAEDERVFDIRVAGPAALLIAKLHKIQDRRGSPARSNDKDALDVFRLLRGTTTEEMSVRYHKLLGNPRSHDESSSAMQLLQELFAHRRGTGVEMALHAVGPLSDPNEIAASCEILVADLLRAL